MSNSDPSEWRLIDTDLVTVLGILPASESHLYLVLNEPGSGELKIPLGSALAGSVGSGQFAQCSYRGAVRGGFFVENISKGQADAAEGGGQWVSISGRGALSLLEDAIIWNDGTTASTRDFVGMTKAAILIALIDEAQARGALLNLSYDFTAVLDSDGVAWTDSEDYKLNAESSLLDITRQFARTGIDFDILPGTGDFVLSAYKLGKGSDKSETVYLRTGVNCEEVTSDEHGDKIKNALLIAYKGGFVSVSDAVSIAARRRREKLLDLKMAQTASSATTIGAAEVELRKDPQKSISVKIYDGAGPRGFVDYELGDYIMLDVQGTETRYRIYGVQPDWKGDQFSTVIVELNSILYENDIQLAQDVAWLMDQWSTANDAELLAVSYWAAIGNDDFAFDAGTINSFGRFLSMHKIGDVIYFAETNTGRITSYSITSGQWELITAAVTYPHCMTSIGTDLYIGGYGAWKIDTTTNTLTTIGIVLPSSSPVGRILAAAVIGTDVYFGGAFSDVDGVASVNFIRYNSVADTWHACGSGATGRINAMLAVGSDVYLGGSGLTAIDGVAVSFVGKWNGTTGVALGAGLGDDVYTLVAYGTNVLAGGAFTGGISEWNGTSWAILGGGTAGVVHGLSVYLTDVYAIGDFTDLGNYIARYSGSTWWELGTGLNNYAADIVLNDDDVYIVGIFTTAGDKDALYVAAYFNNFEALVDYLENASSSFNMGAAIHAATASAITDSDEVPFWEDVANALRKITWANIKATLKTYFDTLYVALTGNQTIAGIKTFSSDPIIPDEAYDATAWNGSLEPPTKNAVRDKIETVGLPAGSNLQVQVNNSGVFGADDEFEYTLGGQIISLGRDAGAEASAVWSWQTGGISFHNLASWGTGNYSSIRGILARGTKAFPTAAQADDIAMRFRGSAYDGVGLVLSSATGAEIRFVANENQSATNHGMRAEIWTTPNGSTTEAKTLVIGEGGIASNVTANKTLTLTATDNFTLTVPATGQALVATVGATVAGRIPYYNTTTGIVASTTNFVFDGSKLAVGTATPDASYRATLEGAGLLVNFSTNALFDAFTLRNLNTGTSAGVRAGIVSDKGTLYFEAFSAAYTVANWAGKSGLLSSSTLNGLFLASPATIQFDSSNTAVSGFIFNPTDGSFIGNEAGNANGDFRYETDSYDGIFLDASNNSVVLMSNAAGKLGFFGATAIVKGTAFTQTYSTAAHTITQTTMTDPAAYGAGANGYSTAAQASAIHAEVIALRANMIVTQNVLNGLIDDLQALGLV